MINTKTFIFYFTIFSLLIILLLSVYYVLSVNGLILKKQNKEGFSGNEGLTGNNSYIANNINIWNGSVNETITCNFDFTATFLAVAPGGNGHSGCGKPRDGGRGGGGGGGGGAIYYDENFNFKKGNQYNIQITNDKVTFRNISTGDTIELNKGGNGNDCNNPGIGGNYTLSGFNSSKINNGKTGGGGGGNRGRNSNANQGYNYTINGTKFIVGGGGGGGGVYSSAYSGEYNDSNLGDLGSQPGMTSTTGINSSLNAYCYGNGGGGGEGNDATAGGNGGGGAVVVFYVSNTKSEVTTITTLPKPPAPQIVRSINPQIWFDFTDLTNKGVSNDMNDAIAVSPTNQCICTTKADINLPVLQIPNDGYLSVYNSFAITPQMFSVSFWYNINWEPDGYSVEPIVSFLDTDNSKFIGVFIQEGNFRVVSNNFCNPGNYSYQKFNIDFLGDMGTAFPMGTEINAAGGTRGIYGYNPPNIQDVNDANWSPRWIAGTWQHVVFTMSDTLVSYYLNGMLVSTKENTETNTYLNVSSVKILNQPLLKYSNGGPIKKPNKSGFSYLADFRIYDYVLKASDVLGLYSPDAYVNLSSFSPKLININMPPKTINTPLIQYNFKYTDKNNIVPNQGYSGSLNNGVVKNSYISDYMVVMPNASNSYNNDPSVQSSVTANGNITLGEMSICYWLNTNGKQINYYNLDAIWAFKGYSTGVRTMSKDGNPFIRNNYGIPVFLNNLKFTDKWIHITITITNNYVVKFYVNGMPINFTDNTMGKTVSFTPILPLTENYITMPYVGGNTTTPPPSMADLRIYTYVLTDNDVLNLYADTQPTTATTPAPTTPKPTTPAPTTLPPIPTHFSMPYSQIMDVLSKS